MYQKALLLLLLHAEVSSFSMVSTFTGKIVHHATPQSAVSANELTMRKQKASDKRTRRMQRNKVLIESSETQPLTAGSSLVTPMTKGAWTHKTVVKNQFAQKTGGRGRSRKRSIVYSNLSSYHNQFLELLTTEFIAEVS